MNDRPPHRILVVDDDGANRTLLRKLLESAGLSVDDTDSGAAALALIANEKPDLVLLDMMMPGLSGLEVLERIRSQFPAHELPVIMATARTESESIVEALSFGANDYITKPFDRPVLIARVLARLAIHRRDSAQDETGKGLLDGRYRLERQIGTGGESVVWRGRHAHLDKPVAIKLVKLPQGGARDPGHERLRQEGIAACRVEHKNAVDVLDFGITDENQAFLVMELLIGHDLAAEVAKVRQLSMMRTIEVLLPVASVLAEAHREGLVHRDVKPGNIFLHQSDTGEVVKLLDFGVARLLGAEDQPNHGIIGTLSYMAPERLQVQPHDGGCDVYSLGHVLYELLCGAPPFDTRHLSDEDVAANHVHIQPPSIAETRDDVPPSIVALARASMAKDPLDRPSAAEFGIELGMSARR